jgi:hypothetical protein
MLSLAPAVAIVAILTASAPCWADEPKPLVAVLVAKSDVAPWEPIEEPEKLFKVVHYLKGEEPRDAVTGFEQVKGRRINCRLTEDQPLKRSHILAESRPAILIGPQDGVRVMAIKISDKSVTEVMVGKRFDIFATFKEAGMEPVTEMMGKNLLVLACDRGEKGGCAFSLVVTPEEGQALSRIGKAVNVQLKLCGVGEKSSAKDGAQAK